MHELPPFHLAFPVTSLANARAFYGELLGCPEGRSSADWVDFDFYGHQIVAHLAPEEATMFLLDPCGNALEFKAFADRAQLFAR
jgi:extradiol dioxygenase family protein